MKMDGFDDCIIGFVEQFGRPPILAYDTRKVIKKLMESGMTYDEADEYFQFNQIGAYVGEQTPAFVMLTCKEMAEEAVSEDGHIDNVDCSACKGKCQ